VLPDQDPRPLDPWAVVSVRVGQFLSFNDWTLSAVRNVCIQKVILIICLNVPLSQQVSCPEKQQPFWYYCSMTTETNPKFLYRVVLTVEVWGLPRVVRARAQTASSTKVVPPWAFDFVYSKRSTSLWSTGGNTHNVCLRCAGWSPQDLCPTRQKKEPITRHRRFGLALATPYSIRIPHLSKVRSVNVYQTWIMHWVSNASNWVSFALFVSRPDYARLFHRNERGTCQERWWPRFKEIDFRDTGLREVARHTTIISGCFARKKYHFINTL